MRKTQGNEMNTRMIAGGLLLIYLIGSFQPAAHAEEKKPNIVFLFTDDQCVSSVGCYGNPEVKTPNMDQLGRDGVIFNKHYNTTSICMASRANVFTGMYEYKTGTNFSHGDMQPEVWEKTYPVLMRKAGYLTAFAGKFGLEVHGKGLCKEDFDYWGGGPGQTFYETKKNVSMGKYADEFPHSSLSYGAFGRDVIRDAVKKDRPFCLSISYKAPHRPVSPDPKFKHVYKGKKFTKPANYGRQAGEHMSPQSKTGRQYPRFEAWNYDKNYDGVMAKYYQQIYAVDVSIGMIREELKAQGVADNTVIIFTSDNGFICGSHGYGSKVLPMEESARAPLIVCDPRIAPEKRADRRSELTGNIDMAPTMLELAGLEIPENVDGMSLVPLLEKKPAENWREQLAFMNVYGVLGTHSLTCITADRKYTYWWYGDETMEPVEEMFDLAGDPLEMTNQATDPQHAGKLAEMRQRYDRELDLWKQYAVSYNNYRPYGTLFDRNIPWQEKNYRKINHAKKAKGKARKK